MNYRGTYWALTISVQLAGCGYYPHNQAAIAIPSDKTMTFTASVLPTTIKKKENEYDDIVRMESLAAVTWKLGSGGIFFSPSLFYLGAGSGIGYIFDTKTVLSGFAGTSFYPISLASGISVSQAVSNHFFIEYRLNYSKLHYLNCGFGCYEEDNGEFSIYHSVNFAALFGMFYSEFNIEATSFNKEYISYGLSLGIQVAK